jgi:hypothetical protein
VVAQFPPQLPVVAHHESHVAELPDRAQHLETADVRREVGALQLERQLGGERHVDRPRLPIP